MLENYQKNTRHHLVQSLKTTKGAFLRDNKKAQKPLASGPQIIKPE
jgi:hypothetical protein